MSSLTLTFADFPCIGKLALLSVEIKAGLCVCLGGLPDSGGEEAPECTRAESGHISFTLSFVGKSAGSGSKSPVRPQASGIPSAGFAVPPTPHVSQVCSAVWHQLSWEHGNLQV